MATKKVTETTKIVKAETKDVDFGELELKIAKPAMNSDKTIVVSGNFTELGANIQKVVNKYKGVKLTEDNVDYVKTLKAQFVSLRTGIERERKEYKKVYLDPAENLLKAMCDELLKIVDEGESALGKQLDEYDQRRKDELTIVLQDYVNDSVAKYGLREEYASQIQLKKEYYNKTQKEEDSIDDIDEQARELSVKQKDYDNGVALIKMECEDAGLLPDAYIRELNYKAPSEIILEIKMDKKSRAEMIEKADNGEKVIIGKELEAELAKAEEKDKDELRTRVLKIQYKPEQAKAIANFFKSSQIKFEFIDTDF